jgi:hypothetical protein
MFTTNILVPRAVHSVIELPSEALTMLQYQFFFLFWPGDFFFNLYSELVQTVSKKIKLVYHIQTSNCASPQS